MKYVAVGLLWLLAAGPAAIFYRLMRKPWAAWCLSLVTLLISAVALAFLNLFLGVYLILVGPWIAGAVTSSLEAIRSGLDRKVRLGGAIALVAVAGLITLDVVPRVQLWPDLVRAAWLRRQSELSRLAGFPQTASAEASSFARFFARVRRASSGRGQQRPGLEGEAPASAFSANPFPGLLSGEHYGRLEFWPPGAPAGQVPLLWDTAAYRGKFSVLFLDGTLGTLTAGELEQVIERIQDYRRPRDSVGRVPLAPDTATETPPAAGPR